MYSSQSLGLVVCMPGPHGGTSQASMPSAKSGVTKINNSISLTCSFTLRNAAPK